ncbi:MAG TPA: anaerobic sulfatase maturase [bacterium]|nr:anaerobic sulfatase maturase [bacterium]HOM26364.1 anaerobic sulfatase maturase [bacterium]
MDKIELLVKPTSYLCNLDCSYCFYKKTKQIYPEAKIMDLKTLEFFIKKFMDYSEGKNIFFCWQGGEPLIAGIEFYYNVVEFQKKYGKTGQIVGNTIQTNGILIDDKWIEFFKRYNVFVGISLDGPEEIHNFYRGYKDGKKTFKKVMENINKLERNGVQFNILSTIGEETGKYPEKIFEFFVKKGFKYLQFIPATDRKKDKISKFSITPSTYSNFLCRIFDLWWNNGFPYVSIRFFDNIIEIIKGIEPSACTLKKRCGEYLVVEHNGDVYPCDFFVNTDFKLGNIFFDELDIIYEKLKKFGAMKEIQIEKCKKCEWNFICNNGCLWHRYVKNGKLDGTDYFCFAYRKFFTYSFEKFKIISERVKLF